MQSNQFLSVLCLLDQTYRTEWLTDKFAQLRFFIYDVENGKCSRTNTLYAILVNLSSEVVLPKAHFKVKY